MKKFLLVCIFLVLCNISFASNYLSGEGKIVPQDPIFNKTITVPLGRVITITTSNNINSAELNTIDRVYAVLKNDFVYNGKMIAQEGSTVIGTVTKVTRPQNEKPAEVIIKFTNIVTPNGQSIPISAIINTYDKTGILRGEIGEDVNIEANSNLEIVIKQPITFIPQQ